MIPTHLSPLANHVWQSTLSAGVLSLLTLAFRKHRAQMRYGLWMAASLKFLIPFSLLVAVGSQFEWRTAPAVAPPLSSAMVEIAQPFTLPAITVVPSPRPTAVWTFALALLWICGFAAILSRWWVRWRRIRLAVRTASPLLIQAPIKVMSSPTRLEPGVFGVFRPVLLLPEGIADHLSPAQLKAILAHELCHVRRRDNLASAFHMLVQAIFWFHPLVWWIGARLIEERERACDEEVLCQGADPQAYAAGILKVCKFYLESPLPCAAGVTGADLKKRIEAIMTNRILTTLTPARKLLLAATGALVVSGPIFLGILTAPRSHAQTEAGLKFEVASIKPADPTTRGMGLDRSAGGGLSATGVTLKTLIELAYEIQDFQLSGGPSWLRNDRYDIVARPDHLEGPAEISQATGAQQRLLWEHWRERLRSLLAERFQLSVRHETKEGSVFTLVVGKNGHKLRESDNQGGVNRNFGVITGKGTTTEMFAHVLSGILVHPVVDATGLTGKYDFKLEWTEEPHMIDKGGGLIGTTPAPADPSGPSIFSAIQDQLGLKLEPRKGPIESIVIERAERPSAN